MSSPPELIDIAANLTHKSFQPDLEQVYERAASAGVGEMVITGTSMRASEQARRLASAGAHLVSTAGVHPHHADEWDDRSAESQRAMARDPSVAVIGECGLDYNRNFSKPENQRRCFREQLEVAAELSMPVYLHERDAHEDFLKVLEEMRPKLPKAVVHCFTGTREVLRAYLELDCHIGITGWICDERRGMHLRDIVGEVPANRLMVETDAPFILPRTIRPRPKSRRNEPAFLPYVAEMIAECVGKPVEQVAQETTATARSFFWGD